MRCNITAELKALRLYGMVGAWADLTAQGEVGTASSKWLIEHLLQAENTDRAMRSVSHQLKAARFPIHRDLARFDFTASRVDKDLVTTLATLDFTDTAQNVVFIGGPGTGKTHLASAVAVSAGQCVVSPSCSGRHWLRIRGWVMAAIFVDDFRQVRCKSGNR